MNFLIKREQPLVKIIIPVHNDWQFTKKCILSLKKIKYKNIKIMIINDGSTDNTSQELKKHFPKVQEIKGDGDLWDSGARNKAVKYILKLDQHPEYILSINNDIQFEPDFLNHLLDFCEKKKRKCVAGPKILYADKKKKIWQYGTGLDLKKAKLYLAHKDEQDSERFDKTKAVDNLTGMCLLIPFEVFKKNVFWDEKNFPMYLGDSDFVLKAKKAGHPSYVVGKSKIYSYVEHSASRSWEKLPFAKLLKFVFSSPKSTWHPKLVTKFFWRHYGAKAGITACLRKIVSLFFFLARELRKKVFKNE
jgi:GT2 family glycosyltransferase